MRLSPNNGVTNNTITATADMDRAIAVVAHIMAAAIIVITLTRQPVGRLSQRARLQPAHGGTPECAFQFDEACCRAVQSSDPVTPNPAPHPRRISGKRGNRHAP